MHPAPEVRPESTRRGACMPEGVILRCRMQDRIMSQWVEGRDVAAMYRKKAGGWLKHLDFIVLDALSLQAAFLLAYAVRMGPSSPYGDDAYREIGVIFLLAQVVIVLLSGSFSGVLRRGNYEEL